MKKILCLLFALTLVASAFAQNWDTNPASARAIPGQVSSGTNRPAGGGYSYVITDSNGNVLTPSGFNSVYQKQLDYRYFVSTNFSDKTNELYVSGAGTTAANGKYLFASNSFGTGFVFTNVSGGAFLCKNLGGNQTGNGDQNPFYLGATTNADTGSVWYYNTSDVRGQWSNNQPASLDGVSGASPAPFVVYGTNQTISTNLILCSPGQIQELAQHKIVLVDTVNGSDAGAALGLCPYSTCASAKNAASSGTTIHVYGNVNETNLLKNGVNWKFYGSVGYEPQPWQGNSPVFTDAGIGAVTSNIEGDLLHFYSKSPAATQAAIWIQNTNSLVTLKFREADCALYPVLSAGQQSCSVALVSNCSRVVCDFQIIGNRSAGQTNQLINPDLNSTTYGTLRNIPSADCGFYWYGGEFHTSFKYMNCTHGTASTFGPASAFWSATPSSVTTQTDWYIKGDEVDGFAYFNDATTQARVWMTTQEVRGGNDPAWFAYGAGKYYLNTLKASTALASLPSKLFARVTIPAAAGLEIKLTCMSIIGPTKTQCSASSATTRTPSTP